MKKSVVRGPWSVALLTGRSARTKDHGLRTTDYGLSN